MIGVKRLGGGRFILNDDLIERIESAPDTIIVLIDGTRFIVEESMEKVLYLIREDRARLLARVEQIAQNPQQQDPEEPTVHLSLASPE